MRNITVSFSFGQNHCSLETVGDNLVEPIEDLLYADKVEKGQVFRPVIRSHFDVHCVGFLLAEFFSGGVRHGEIVL